MPDQQADNLGALRNVRGVGLPDGTTALAVAAFSPSGTSVIIVEQQTYQTVMTGEIAGAVSAIIMPTVGCKLLKFKAAYDNAGRVYIGRSGVTKADGTTDNTTGWQLQPGEETAWIPVDNANRFYRICDNAGDDLVYIALT